jgi:hypothetical protein
MTQTMQNAKKFKEFDPATRIVITTDAINQLIQAVGISGNSILLAGNDRSTTIPDILGLVRPLEVTTSTTAAAESYHWFSGASSICVLATSKDNNAKIIVIPGQQVSVRNTTSSTIRIFARRVGEVSGNSATHFLGSSITLGPYQELPLYA